MFKFIEQTFENIDDTTLAEVEEDLLQGVVDDGPAPASHSTAGADTRDGGNDGGLPASLSTAGRPPSASGGPFSASPSTAENTPHADEDETDPKRPLKSVIAKQTMMQKYAELEEKYLVVVQEKEALIQKEKREREQREENERMREYAMKNMPRFAREEDFTREEIAAAVANAEKEDREENERIIRLPPDAG